MSMKECNERESERRRKERHVPVGGIGLGPSFLLFTGLRCRSTKNNAARTITSANRQCPFSATYVVAVLPTIQLSAVETEWVGPITTGYQWITNCDHSKWTKISLKFLATYTRKQGCWWSEDSMNFQYNSVNVVHAEGRMRTRKAGSMWLRSDATTFEPTKSDTTCRAKQSATSTQSGRTR